MVLLCGTRKTNVISQSCLLSLICWVLLFGLPVAIMTWFNCYSFISLKIKKRILWIKKKKVAFCNVEPISINTISSLMFSNMLPGSSHSSVTRSLILLSTPWLQSLCSFTRTPFRNTYGSWYVAVPMAVALSRGSW